MRKIPNQEPNAAKTTAPRSRNQTRATPDFTDHTDSEEEIRADPLNLWSKFFSKKQHLSGLRNRGAGVEQKVTKVAKGGKDGMADPFFVIFVTFCSSFSVGSLGSCVEQEVRGRRPAATTSEPTWTSQITRTAKRKSVPIREIRGQSSSQKNNICVDCSAKIPSRPFPLFPPFPLVQSVFLRDLGDLLFNPPRPG